MNTQGARHMLQSIHSLLLPRCFPDLSHFDTSVQRRYDIDDTTLQLEIQQLGLPKENTDVLSRAFREMKDTIQQRLLETSFRINSLTGVEWRVDQVLASSHSEPGPRVKVKLTVDNAPSRVSGSGKRVACVSCSRCGV